MSGNDVVNPFARRVAELRLVLVRTLSDEDLEAIAKKLIETAKSGDLRAIRLLLSYTLGKPARTVNPDRVDVDEWSCLKESAAMTAELPGVANRLDPDMVLGLGRKIRGKPAIPRMREKAEIGERFRKVAS